MALRVCFIITMAILVMCPVSIVLILLGVDIPYFGFFWKFSLYWSGTLLSILMIYNKFFI